jgi:hypothetical protein
MKISRKFIGQASLFVLAATVLSSCSRGYGCPNNFNMNESLVDVVKTVITFIF